MELTINQEVLEETISKLHFVYACASYNNFTRDMRKIVYSELSTFENELNIASHTSIIPGGGRKKGGSIPMDQRFEIRLFGDIDNLYAGFESLVNSVDRFPYVYRPGKKPFRMHFVPHQAYSTDTTKDIYDKIREKYGSKIDI